MWCSGIGPHRVGDAGGGPSVIHGAVRCSEVGEWFFVMRVSAVSRGHGPFLLGHGDVTVREILFTKGLSRWDLMEVKDGFVAR